MLREMIAEKIDNWSLFRSEHMTIDLMIATQVTCELKFLSFELSGDSPALLGHQGIAVV